MNPKIIKLRTLKQKIKDIKKSSKKIAFTNGCFDILHYGHVSYLKEAKGKNHILIVGLNSDISVKKIKGKKRPIIPEQERASVLAALEAVDYVILFDEDTPQKLIEAILPDVLIKGADWKNKTVVGQDIVEANGGRVQLVNYVPHCSSTRIIRKIINKCAK